MLLAAESDEIADDEVVDAEAVDEVRVGIGTSEGICTGAVVVLLLLCW